VKFTVLLLGLYAFALLSYYI